MCTDIILQGLINKDDATLTVPSIKGTIHSALIAINHLLFRGAN